MFLFTAQKIQNIPVNSKYLFFRGMSLDTEQCKKGIYFGVTLIKDYPAMMTNDLSDDFQQVTARIFKCLLAVGCSRRAVV